MAAAGLSSQEISRLRRRSSTNHHEEGPGGLGWAIGAQVLRSAVGRVEGCDRGDMLAFSDGPEKKDDFELRPR